MRKHAPVKIIEAPVRAYIPTSLPPGSIHGGPSIAGSGECCSCLFTQYVSCLFTFFVYLFKMEEYYMIGKNQQYQWMLPHTEVYQTIEKSNSSNFNCLIHSSFCILK